MLDVRIKQRLIGALVLLALVFLIVPVVLDGDGRLPEKITQIPPKPKRPDVSHIRVAEPVRDVLQPLPEYPSESDSTGDSSGSASESSEPTVSEPSTVELNGKAWSVQVASFRQSGKASELRDQLRDAGFETYVNEVILSDGTLFTQVLVGPVTDFDRVRKRKEEIKQSIGLQGLVVRYKP